VGHFLVLPISILAITVSILTKAKLLTKQPKMSNLHVDLSLKLSQGEVHDFSGEVQKLSGEVQNDLRGGAHLPTPPLKIPPWLGSYPGTISASIFFCLSLVSYKCVVMYSTV
jgi:hypothetical protein